MHAIPSTALLEYFSKPLFQGPKGEWLDERLKEARALAQDPTSLLRKFQESLELFEHSYSNYQPFHPKRHEFEEKHGKEPNGGVDVAARLRCREHPKWRERIWKVGNDRSLDFVYLDREIELARSNPGPPKPDDDTPLGNVLIADLFLANAYDRMPILGEVKVRTDQCPFYALIQIVCEASYAATPSQRERLVLFGSRDDFVLSESLIDERTTIDLYILLVKPSKAQIYCDLRDAAIDLSEKLVDDKEFGRNIGRIAWITGDEDDAEGLIFQALASATSDFRTSRAPDSPLA
jgi:hypothetical protein